MAIEGRVNFKGINLENSYIKVKSVMIKYLMTRGNLILIRIVKLQKPTKIF